MGSFSLYSFEKGGDTSAGLLFSGYPAVADPVYCTDFAAVFRSADFISYLFLYAKSSEGRAAIGGAG